MLCKQYAMACMFGRPGADLAGVLLACGIAPSAVDPTTGYEIALTRSSGALLDSSTRCPTMRDKIRCAPEVVAQRGQMRTA
ncbi:hypothetical protein A4G27_16115 [Mycobacterium kansasii]|nr:hypothetical protein A4G27_16115 [Mycobacterium kansasii]